MCFSEVFVSDVRQYYSLSLPDAGEASIDLDKVIEEFAKHLGEERGVNLTVSDRPDQRERNKPDIDAIIEGDSRPIACLTGLTGGGGAVSILIQSYRSFYHGQV